MDYRVSTTYITCENGRCSSLQDPCEGRDPSCNRSIAGEMGSCLRRNPELPRIAPTEISFGIVSSEADWKWITEFQQLTSLARTVGVPLYRIPAKAGTHRLPGIGGRGVASPQQVPAYGSGLRPARG